MFNFKGKVAVVTGGEMGIGRAVVLALTKYGAKAVAAGIDNARGKEIQSQNPESIQFIYTDVTSMQDIRNLAQNVKITFGNANILINCAGIYATGTATETEVKTWENIMAVNVTGMFLVTKAFIPQMLEIGGGVIVNVSSEAGLVAIPNQIAYNTSKSAVIGFTKSLAVDYARSNIRANAVCPGTTHTPLLEKSLSLSKDPESALKKLETSRPANRLGKPEEIALAILALAADDLAYATGSVLSIDGGFTAQ